MKKILILIILILMSFATACNKKDNYKTYGDFIYKVINKNAEGRDIDKDTKDQNVVDTYVRIYGLSEEGKQKEIIVVPETIDGIKVKEIGRNAMWGSIGMWESDNLRRVYIPFPVIVWGVFDKLPKKERVIVLEHEVIRGDRVYITSYYRNGTNPHGFGSDGIYANVSYMYNYDDSPNFGYYWIDDYDYGTKITYIPENPTREGYIFDGWYKEEECINKWDFDVDKLPEGLYDDEHNLYFYQETILYAKWVILE